MSYRTLATRHGCIWYHPERVAEPTPALFDPRAWQTAARVTPAGAGRGAAWFISDGARELVLRGYRRGGAVGRLVHDWYLFTGARRTRPAREWRMLVFLESRDLPAPRPVAAQYVRSGLVYRADMLTERLAGTRSLSEHLVRRPLDAAHWRDIGHTVRMFHDAGVWHADLNAHNILLGADGRTYLIDFDRARLRSPGTWRQANLDRLARSLRKLAAQTAPFHFTGAEWEALLAGYGSPDW